MDRFPQLRTGQVMQYPAQRTMEQPTQILRFVDGREQRVREQREARRKWVVRLDLLDESEMATLEQFFAAMQGRSGTFAFVDPWTGTEYANCSFDQDEAEFTFTGHNRGKVNLVIRENAD